MRYKEVRFMKGLNAEGSCITNAIKTRVDVQRSWPWIGCAYPLLDLIAQQTNNVVCRDDSGQTLLFVYYRKRCQIVFVEHLGNLFV